MPAQIDNDCENDRNHYQRAATDLMNLHELFIIREKRRRRDLDQLWDYAAPCDQATVCGLCVRV